MEYDEINLRPYLASVGRRWHWIVIGAVLTCIVAAGVSLLLPKEYEATASLLVLIRESNIGIGPDGPLSTIETIDAQSRRQGMVALATSDAIESRLPQDFVATLDVDGYRPGRLLQDKRVQAYQNGELISFLATGPTAEEAQQLANTWARSFNDYARELYNDELVTITLASEALLPLQPASPNIIGNVLLGFALGALLGLGLAMLASVVRLPQFAKVTNPAKASPGQPSPTR